MKFFRDSYSLTVSACEYFCTNHISVFVWEPRKNYSFRGNFENAMLYLAIIQRVTTRQHLEKNAIR